MNATPGNAGLLPGLSVDDFVAAVDTYLGKRLDANQEECVTAPSDESLFLVAGPGSGKTTAITLRMLRLMFVECFDPAAIVATTFTNRAATELRSRVLGWATMLREGLLRDDALPATLEAVDLNRVVTGTLDS